MILKLNIVAIILINFSSFEVFCSEIKKRLLTLQLLLSLIRTLDSRKRDSKKFSLLYLWSSINYEKY